MTGEALRRHWNVVLERDLLLGVRGRRADGGCEYHGEDDAKHMLTYYAPEGYAPEGPSLKPERPRDQPGGAGRPAQQRLIFAIFQIKTQREALSTELFWPAGNQK